VSESVWSDFCQHRKAKAAKLTQTALDGIQREADKAGWSLEDALRECCTRGWTGFKADWVSVKRGTGQASEPKWRTDERERMQVASPRMAAKAPSGPETFDAEVRNVTAIGLD
jgi:hypothetical protein